MKSSFKGWIGATAKREIAGWIANLSDTREQYFVDILVNGSVLAKVLADEPRSSLRKKGFESINHGFTLPLTEDLDPAHIEELAMRPSDYPEILIRDKRSVNTGSGVPRAKATTLPEEESSPEAEKRLSKEDQRLLAMLIERLGSPEPEAGWGEKVTLSKKVEQLTAQLETRKKQIGVLQEKEKIVKRLDDASRRSLGDAVRKAWGGYSELGRVELEKLAVSPMISGPVRAAACYELARYYADRGQPFSAAKMISDARSLSKGYMRGLRPRLLEYELLLATEDMETALQRMETHVHYRPEDPNYRIGLANYYLKTESPEGQLGAINAIYDRAGMARVQILDPLRPFLSLSAEGAPPVTEGPKVSVLMSCYNCADYLELAVRSMQEQTWRNLEIIVTDDCSTDGSLELLKALAADDPRLVIRSNKETHGTYGNRNRMLDICNGDYVTVHDADDWSHPQMIEHQMAHLLENPEIRVNTTLMCRVSPELKFHLRPSRASLEYCHMNYPGFLMRTEDVKALGGWDPIMANADAEFERRVKQVHGKEAFALINPTVTYSFFLVHEKSLTQQKLMNLRSLTFGSRNEYHRQSEFWMARRRAESMKTGDQIGPFVLDGRPSRKDPFPSPNSLLFPSLKQEVLEYDVLIVSDLFLLGGTRSCNVHYVKMLHSMGKKVAMFHWPRGDLRFAEDIHPTYRQLAQEGLIEIVTWEDRIKADTVIVHHPPLANADLDNYPVVATEKVAVLVNQLPFQTTDRIQNFYSPGDVTARLKRVFGTQRVEWIAISPLTHEYLADYSKEITLVDQIWYPPISLDPAQILTRTEDRLARLRQDGPSLARHSRDHWTKWPTSGDTTARMYMAEANHRFSVLGGGKMLERKLPQGLPENWTVHPYDAIEVSELLEGSDIYLNFNNEIYIEEFGRNIMEAMVFGLPVVAAPVFEKTFGKAILVADRDGPEAQLERLRTDAVFFEEQVARGQDFVKRHCASSSVIETLESYLG